MTNGSQWNREKRTGLYKLTSKSGEWLVDRALDGSWKVLEPKRESEMGRYSTLKEAKESAEKWAEIFASVL